MSLFRVCRRETKVQTGYWRSCDQSITDLGFETRCVWLQSANTKPQGILSLNKRNSYLWVILFPTQNVIVCREGFHAASRRIQINLQGYVEICGLIMVNRIWKSFAQIEGGVFHSQIQVIPPLHFQHAEPHRERAIQASQYRNMSPWNAGWGFSVWFNWEYH